MGDEIIRGTAFDLRQDGVADDDDDEDDDEVKYYDGESETTDEKEDGKDETVSMNNGPVTGKDANGEQKKSDNQEHESKAFE